MVCSIIIVKLSKRPFDLARQKWFGLYGVLMRLSKSGLFCKDKMQPEKFCAEKLKQNFCWCRHLLQNSKNQGKNVYLFQFLHS